MKNIYLHIGSHKTGTSAIQDAFVHWKESGLLEKHDFNFTLLSHDVHMLTNSTHNKQEVYTLFSTKLIEFIEKTHVNNFVFSSEGLSSPIILEHADIVDILAKTFRDYSVKILYYIRRQDIACESMWAQRHKHFLSPIEFEAPHSNLKQIFDLYRKYFQKEQVCVRVYDKKKLLNNDVVSDFLNWLHLDEFIPLIEKKSANENTSLNPSQLRITLSYMRQNRLSPEAIAFKMKELRKSVEKEPDQNMLVNAGSVNIHTLGTNSNSIPPISNVPMSPEELWALHANFLMIGHGINSNIAFAEDLQKLFSLSSQSASITHAYMPLEMRKKFLEECREENEYIVQEYFDKETIEQQGGQLFDMSMPKETVSLESPSTDDLVSAFLPMLVHLKQKVDILEQENKALQERLAHLEKKSECTELEKKNRDLEAKGRDAERKTRPIHLDNVNVHNRKTQQNMEKRNIRTPIKISIKK